MTTFKLAVTWSRRLHYSDNLKPSEYRDWATEDPGREGTAICNGNYWVYDRVAFHRFGRPGHYKPAEFADLPLCKRCAKKAGAS